MGFSVLERPLSFNDQAAQLFDTTALEAMPGIGIPAAAADAIDHFSARRPQAMQGFMQGMTGNPLSSMFGFIPGGNVLQGLLNMLQQLLAGNAIGGGNEQYFQSANGGSVGDPHLSFNGKTWDNMGSQPDLLHSDSFDGGYQLSTQTTTPAPNGVTYNQSATVSTNYGNTSVTFDKNGTLSISQYGDSFSLAPGQSVDLDNGELVQRQNDGTVVVTCNNGAGGTIATTLKSNGTGVDVTTTANNVDLGGALVSGIPVDPGQRTLEPMMHYRHHPPMQRLV